MPGKMFIAINCDCRACPECEAGFDTYMDLTLHEHKMCKHEAAYMRRLLRKPGLSLSAAK